MPEEALQDCAGGVHFNPAPTMAKTIVCSLQMRPEPPGDGDKRTDLSRSEA